MVETDKEAVAAYGSSLYGASLILYSALIALFILRISSFGAWGGAGDGGLAEGLPAPTPAVLEGGRGAAAGLVLGSKMNLATVTARDLAIVPGIGPALARAVVGERRRVGGFTSVDDLDEVPGIGPKRLEAFREYLEVR